jgi:hypothetical protein
MTYARSIAFPPHSQKSYGARTVNTGREAVVVKDIAVKLIWKDLTRIIIADSQRGER